MGYLRIFTRDSDNSVHFIFVDCTKDSKGRLKVKSYFISNGKQPVIINFNPEIETFEKYLHRKGFIEVDKSEHEKYLVLVDL